MTRKKYIEKRLIELSFKEDKDALDIREEQDLENELKEILSKKEKQSYFLDIDASMHDMAYCTANCAKQCARRKTPFKYDIFAVSDFSEVCFDFKKNKTNDNHTKDFKEISPIDYLEKPLEDVQNKIIDLMDKTNYIQENLNQMRVLIDCLQKCVKKE